MKKLKLMVAIIALLVISNLVCGADPKSKGTYMIKSLSKDILLTDSQKVIIEAKASKFENLLETTTSLEDDPTLKQAFNEYKAVLDSTLTVEQKEQLIQKRNSRKEATINEFKNKNKK